MLAAASTKVMDALFGFLVRNDAEWTINESFWDAHGVEIGACANFDPKTFVWRTGNIFVDWMLWGHCCVRQALPNCRRPSPLDLT